MIGCLLTNEQTNGNDGSDTNTADGIAEANLHHLNVDINISRGSKEKNSSTGTNNQGMYHCMHLGTLLSEGRVYMYTCLNL